ncbi:response regulator transcription factor [Conexibacter sp. CPCC 206217]|uniref:response regulator n=1 Tax=Conexibacter sp. CPCC 206217 TaxID=3064574 RepID=UPI0027188641|nr:response regulator transcription factor [Conexibacter sp. CPCC 206217]MDO8212395.1 response regulator transcription factor [Conexibacter sp. CPCC 206217]
MSGPRGDAPDDTGGGREPGGAGGLGDRREASGGAPIRVLLADDHGVIRDGLGRLISALDGLELVGVAADGAQALAQTLRTEPDVVLMDLEMPVMDGIEATRRILAQRPQTAVLVLTSFSDRPRIVGALEAGACGYLLKDVDAEQVAEGIRAAARGESPLDPRAARTMLTARTAPDPLAALSAREREVLTLLVEGLPNKLIARRLEISEKTVKSHLTNVFRAIGVSDRTQAALWAERNGLRGGGG